MRNSNRLLGFILALALALPLPAWAVVAFDAASQELGDTGTLTWTHTPVGTPRGVLCWVVQFVGATDEVTGVTYGGVAMTEVSGSPLLKAGGETAAVYLYFLGASIPTGAQTVTASVNGTGSNKNTYCFTVTGAANTEIVDVDATISSNSVANPSVTLSLGGRTSFAAIGFMSGAQTTAEATPSTNWTMPTNEWDPGTMVGGAYYYDIVASTDVAAGWTQAAEDAVAIAIAISEVTATTRRSGGLLGVGQ